MARVYDNYSSLITFTRASSGTALRPISYGDELVTNGTFDSDSDWTKETPWTISSGVASFDASNNANLQQADIGMEVGKIYQFRFEITSGADANFSLFASGSSDQYIVYTDYAIGTHSVNFVCTGGDGIRIAASKFVGSSFSIDNISVREVLFDQPNGTLTLFNHPTNIPRIEYDSDGNRLGLLVEESRTNLVSNSNFDTGWALSNSSLETDAAVSPDGKINAVKLKVNTNTTHHSVYESVAGGTYAVSVFAKAGEYDGIQITGVNTPNDHACFNLVDGTAYHTGSNASNAAIEYVGNGWYRCSAIIPVTNGNLYITVTDGISTTWLPSFAGANTTDGVYIYGAQAEAGSFPTSLIPTSGSTATRSADVASIGVSEFGYNQSEGTLFVEFSPFINTTQSAVMSVGSSSTNAIGVYSYNTYQLRNVVGGSSNVLLDNGAVSDENKVAATYKVNDFTLSLNGNSVSTDTSGDLQAIVNTTMYIGSFATINQYSGHIKSIKYYPRALTATQIQELTS